jgi:hypothetical protein
MIGRGSTAPLVHPSGILVLVDTVRYCDTKHQHEVHVLTDGGRVYAYGQVTDADAGSRYGTEITVTCGQPGIDDVACEGTVTVDLAEDGIWEAATPARAGLLDQFGTAVDQ